MATTRHPRRRGFGTTRKLASGRYQVRYFGPDALRHKAPVTFITKGDAETYLAGVLTDITREKWVSPAARPRSTAAPRLTEYADAWLRTRTLKPRTVELYRSLLDNHINPPLGDEPLSAVTPVTVRRWYAALDTGPTAKANAYGLLRTILAEAVDDGILASNPVRIKGAGSKKRARELRVLSIAEFDALVTAIPARYKSLVLLGGWCAMRFGELAALRRCDLDLKNGIVHIRQAVTTVKSRTIVGEPKSDAGIRSVTIPPHILPALKDHMQNHATFGREGLVFPTAHGDGYLAGSTLYRVFKRAKVKAGRPDVRVHDLRHFGAIMAARSGATLGELQQRLGHSTAQAAMIYQSAVSERPTEIAASLSALAEGKQRS